MAAGVLPDFFSPVVIATRTGESTVSCKKRDVKKYLNTLVMEDQPVSLITILGDDKENFRKLFTSWLVSYAHACSNGIPVSSLNLCGRNSLPEALRQCDGKDDVLLCKVPFKRKGSVCFVLYATSAEICETFAALASSVILTYSPDEEERLLDKLISLDVVSSMAQMVHQFPADLTVQPGSVEELKLGQKFQTHLEKLQFPGKIDSMGGKIYLYRLVAFLEGVCRAVNSSFNDSGSDSNSESSNSQSYPKAPAAKVAEKSSSLTQTQCLDGGSHEVTANDLLSSDMEDMDVDCMFGMVRCSMPKAGIEMPLETVPFEVPCPVRGCDFKKIYEWVCCEPSCQTILQFDFRGFVYCRCGQSDVKELNFKCPLQRQNCFENPNPTLLNLSIGQIKPMKQLNILILGETGVGKSTWINGFVNFLSYESLDAAEAGELKTLVPTQFTVYNEEFNEILVSTGTDQNEVNQVGQSATQSAQIYPFKVGKTLIRIVDTPGIGDTRGPAQDQQNFENILGTLANIDVLHGICILLKPNNARLNVMFRFCIKELLTYLHRDASKNIMFCFTNSRGTFYRPGDTMPALLGLLKENKDVSIPVDKMNVFCYDSEAYRFLAAIKNDPPVVFATDERENFSNSWTKSIQETKRMLEYISKLRPHKLNSTLNLNNTRQLVLKLARPLAEINRNIQYNRKIQEDHRNDIFRTNETVDELLRKRMTKRTTIKVQQLSHPKTVCSNKACVKVWHLDKDLSTNEYITICHEPCQLTGTPADSIGHINLMGCWALKHNNNNCRICGHGYREHLHVYYDSIQVLEDVVDQSVDEAIRTSQSAKEIKEKMIINQTKLLSEFDYEIQKIEESCAYFAKFLKMNAITPYNDAVEQYLDHYINEEMDKIALGGDRTLLNDLMKNKNSYLEQKGILDRSLRTGSGLCGETPLKQEEIWRRVEELKNLKHSGTSLKEALACVTYTQRVEIHTPRSVLSHNDGLYRRIRTRGKNTAHSLYDWFSSYLFR